MASRGQVGFFDFRVVASTFGNRDRAQPTPDPFDVADKLRAGMGAYPSAPNRSRGRARAAVALEGLPRFLNAIPEFPGASTRETRADRDAGLRGSCVETTDRFLAPVIQRTASQRVFRAFGFHDIAVAIRRRRRGDPSTTPVFVERLIAKVLCANAFTSDRVRVAAETRVPGEASGTSGFASGSASGLETAQAQNREDEEIQPCHSVKWLLKNRVKL